FSSDDSFAEFADRPRQRIAYTPLPGLGSGIQRGRGEQNGPRGTDNPALESGWAPAKPARPVNITADLRSGRGRSNPAKAYSCLLWVSTLTTKRSAPLRHHFERLARDGGVRDYSEIARRTGLTRARVTRSRT